MRVAFPVDSSAGEVITITKMPEAVIVHTIPVAMQSAPLSTPAWSRSGPLTAPALHSEQRLPSFKKDSCDEMWLLARCSTACAHRLSA